MIHMMQDQDYPYHTDEIIDPREERRELTLERPLVFLDIQTTGVEPKTARIVEISTLKIDTSGREEFRSKRINPYTPITPDATRKHGISNEDVADDPPFSNFARALAEYIDGCDLAGFGIQRFGMPILRQEFDIAGVPFEVPPIVVDVMQVYHRLEPRNFKAAFKQYVGAELPDDEPQIGEPKLNAIRKILLGQIQLRREVPTTPSAIYAWESAENRPAPIDKGAKFVWSDQDEALINFGRYRGHRLSDLANADADYLQWVASNESFTAEQRGIAGNASEGIMPEQTWKPKPQPNTT